MRAEAASIGQAVTKLGFHKSLFVGLHLGNLRTTLGPKTRAAQLPGLLISISILSWLCKDADFLTYLLTELSPSWEVTNCASTQELPSILRNQKVHHRVHKSPPLVPILSQIDPVHTISLRSILILSTHLRLGLPSGLFPSGFPTNILYAFPYSPINGSESIEI
jgi:hypothetical protein